MAAACRVTDAARSTLRAAEEEEEGGEGERGQCAVDQQALGRPRSRPCHRSCMRTAGAAATAPTPRFTGQAAGLSLMLWGYIPSLWGSTPSRTTRSTSSRPTHRGTSLGASCPRPPPSRTSMWRRRGLPACAVSLARPLPEAACRTGRPRAARPCSPPPCAPRQPPLARPRRAAQRRRRSGQAPWGPCPLSGPTTLTTAAGAAG